MALATKFHYGYSECCTKKIIAPNNNLFRVVIAPNNNLFRVVIAPNNKKITFVDYL